MRGAVSVAIWFAMERRFQGMRASTFKKAMGDGRNIRISALFFCWLFQMLTAAHAAGIDEQVEGNGGQYVVTYRARWRNGIDKRIDRQAPDDDSITVVPVEGFRGFALKTWIRQTDDFSRVANGSPRAELAFAGLTRFAVGGDYEIRWSTMIPRDYDLDRQQPEIITQIHQSSNSGSPPFELILAGSSYQVGVRGPHVLKNFTFGDARDDEGRVVSWLLRYRPDDTGASAVTDLYKDGVLVVRAGSIVNAYPHEAAAYLKIGVYKWDWKTRPSDVSERTMYYGDVEVLSRGPQLAWASKRINKWRAFRKMIFADRTKVRLSDNQRDEKRGAVRVLHVGPAMSSKGGIASVLYGYSENRALFEALGYEFTFAGTCGRTPVERIVRFAMAWLCIVKGAVLGTVDVVHIHTATRGSLLRKCLLAATCVGLRQKYVLHIHSGAMEKYLQALPAFVRKAVRAVWKRSARIVCLSRDMQDWLTLRWKFSVEKCPLIYNGLADPQPLNATEQSEPNRSTVILFLGKLVEAKGIAVLLDAAEALKGSEHSYSLLVGGNGDVQSFLHEIERRRLSDTVKYLGWVTGKEKARLLSSADIFVLPSRSEGFAVSIVEAMAFGAAIVSTDIPGVVDAITHKRDGWLVPPDDAKALYQALSTLISSPELRALLAESARQRFLERFTIQRTAETLADTYRQIMQ